jgi:hypothetical protein
MNCPQTNDECGTSKVVTVTGDTSVVMGKAGINLTRAKSGCSWLIKADCLPFSIGYDATASALIGGVVIADTYKVQYIELRDDSVTTDKPNSNFVFTAGQVTTVAAGAVSMPHSVTQYYSSR